MEIRIDSHEGIRYAVSTSKDECFRTAADFLDILASASSERTGLIVLHETNFSPSFYDLKTGFAGEVLQKCSNYSVRMAIVGKFENVRSTRFRELMSEANKGRDIHFTESADGAVEWLVAGRCPEQAKRVEGRSQ